MILRMVQEVPTSNAQKPTTECKKLYLRMQEAPTSIAQSANFDCPRRPKCQLRLNKCQLRLHKSHLRLHNFDCTSANFDCTKCQLRLHKCLLRLHKCRLRLHKCHQSSSNFQQTWMQAACDGASPPAAPASCNGCERHASKQVPRRRHHVQATMDTTGMC